MSGGDYTLPGETPPPPPQDATNEQPIEYTPPGSTLTDPPDGDLETGDLETEATGGGLFQPPKAGAPAAAAGPRGLIARMIGSAVSGAAGTSAGMAVAGVLIPIVQAEVNFVWSKFQTRPLSAEAAAAAVERDAMTYGAAEKEASLTGYDGTRFAILEKLAGIPPNSEQLIQMVRRRVITKARMREGLIQGNVRSEWADALIQVTAAVPSISQMVHFATRGVYGGSGGLEGTADELPGGLIEDAKRNGLEPADTTKYWAAHWRLPSPTQLYVMLHRGIITAGTVADGLRANDYPPFWRDKLTAIAFHVPTRVDLRRMLEHGVIDEARVLKGYKDLGYTDEDAALLTSFAVELAKPDGKAPAVKTDWIARARGMAFADVHSWVKKGDMNAATAAGALASIGIPEDAAGAAANMWATVVAAHG